ncbi:DNA-formamidopyrimidine glycosylase [bacterium (candidate division B38) B3_B38]|nr:MAG: DNA-formamidopyrimidine glycosylase [bacterium (candidate division B38) B3_B38]
MPELPEVETILRQLERLIKGRKIKEVQVAVPRILYHLSPADFKKRLRGAVFTSFSRRGKFLLCHMNEGELVMLIHFRMTGSLLYGTPSAISKAHTRISFWLDNDKLLCYNDMRKLGKIELIKGELVDNFHELKSLGPDPLSPDFSPQLLYNILQGSRRQVKELLLDQHKIAGLGNIYASEVLFDCGIHPQKKAHSLSPEEVGGLHRSILKILHLAIESRGCSIANYVDLAGESGAFQELRNVYQREGEPCYRCGELICRIKQQQRSTYLCPRCQQ